MFYLSFLSLVSFLTFSFSGFAQESKHVIFGDVRDVSPRTTALFVLMGGGDLDQASLRQMIQSSGRGDIVVLRAVEDQWLSQEIYKVGTMNSVHTLTVPSREAAFEKNVFETLMKAEAVFIAGGDQARYHNYWKDTPVSEALNALVRRQVPIGGTSAGLAILGDYYFSALQGSVSAAEVLMEPHHERISLHTDFLKIPHLSKVITDSHFQERDRMGRLLAFTARLNFEYGVVVHGLGVNEGTSYVFDGHGKSWVNGR